MNDNISYYNFKEGLPLEFEIVSLKELCERGKKLITSSHRTDFYQIIWFKDGTPTHWVDFAPINITSNTILFLNKGTVQKFDPNKAFDGVAILFTDNFFCKSEADIKYLKSSLLFSNLFSVSQIQLQQKAKTFEELLNLIIKESKNKKDKYQSDILKNILHNFLLISEREQNTQNLTEIIKNIDLDLIIHFENLLEKHYTTKKQVGFYSKELHITSKQLNKSTTKILGKTPKEIIDNRVLLEAKRFLTHTNKSVKEIGFALGFDEPTNFIKYFRKKIHSTPVEFREQFASS